jgi:hypothetical protein
MVKSADDNAYVFGVFLVSQKTPDQVIQEILKKPGMTYTQGLSFMVSRFAHETEVESSSIKISVKCPYSMRLMDVPVRGAKCQHPQCFDLE